MRITNRMLHDTALQGLSANVERLARVQEQISTGRRLNRPSDDPARVREAVKLRDGLAELDQYVRNLDAGRRALDASDAALAAGGAALQRVRELAVQGGNDTLSSADRVTMAAEVGQLLDAVLAASRARLGDAYLFSGFRTDLPPFATATSPYQGDGGAIMAIIGPGARLRVNVVGDIAFAPVLVAVEQLRVELAAGDRVSPGTLSALDDAQRALLDARATVGARSNRLEATRDSIDVDALAARRVLSELEDVDLAVALTELSERQATYEAALRVNGLILRTSLIDELR